METISLIDFILTGKFGRVSLGMTKKEVIEYLGTPSEDTDFGIGASGLFYNGFEFFYWTDNKELFTIQNDNIETLFANQSNYEFSDKIIVDNSFFFIGQLLTYKNITAYLRKQNIHFNSVDKGKYDEIQFLSGVTFDFENEELMPHQYDRGDLKLNGIRYEKID